MTVLPSSGQCIHHKVTDEKCDPGTDLRKKWDFEKKYIDGKLQVAYMSRQQQHDRTGRR